MKFDNSNNPLNLNDLVSYPNETKVYKIVEIEKHTNWCNIQEQCNLPLKPTKSANLSDLIKAL